MARGPAKYPAGSTYGCFGACNRRKVTATMKPHLDLTRATLALALVGVMGLGSTSPAFSRGGGGGGRGSSSGSTGSSPPQCRQGLVWDKKVQRCVREQSSILQDGKPLQQRHAHASAGPPDGARIDLFIV
jgi:hypothetical protein